MRDQILVMVRLLNRTVQNIYKQGCLLI